MPKEFPLKPRGFSPFLELVGVNFETIENGYSRAILKLKKKLLNSSGIIHGGATFTLIDCGMGAALFSIIEETDRVQTLETQIIYFKSAGSGVLVCDTRVLNRSRRIATLESEVKHKDELIAKALGTFSISKGKRIGGK